MGHPEERSGKTDEILEPHRLEPQLGTELAQLIGYGIVKEVVARHDGDRCPAVVFVRAQAAQEAQAIDERHAEVENNRIGMIAFGLPQTRFRVSCGMDVVALEPEHPRERVDHTFIIVDNENGGGRTLAGQ